MNRELSSYEGSDSHKVDTLRELVTDLLAELVQSGRMSNGEAAGWDYQARAVVTDRPDLYDFAAQVVDEAEAYTRTSARGR